MGKPESYLTLYFDGACEPVNPDGTGTYGFIVLESGGKAARIAKSGRGIVGKGVNVTNNVAEYYALGYGLKAVAELIAVEPDWIYHLTIRGDSKLVIYQLLGEYQSNTEKPNSLLARCLLARCRQRLDEMTECNLADWAAQWIPRELNEAADDLSKLAYYAHIW